jgi:hypothetical protein
MPAKEAVMRSMLSMSRAFPTRGSLLGSLFLLTLGCGGLGQEPAASPEGSGSQALPAGEPATDPSRLGDLFREAARQFSVPTELLIAIAQVETGFVFLPGVDGDAFEGQPAYGLMALRGERLVRGAELSGQTLDRVKTEPRENILAAAALLRAAAEPEPQGLSGAGVESWLPALVRFSGLTHDEARLDYAKEVYAALARGVSDEINRRHDLRQRPLPGRSAASAPTGAGLDLRSAYYSGAKWMPSPSSNFTSGRSVDVDVLVLHTCAGAWSGCWGWLTTPYPRNPYKTSAHYVVKEDGNEIYALVDEKDTAHHVGKPWMGASTNARSVGIEHAGNSYQGSNVWSTGQMSASLKLSCDIVKRQRIILDRNHVIGHYQPDPVNRATDPGTGFPWASYMRDLATCTGGGGSSDIIIDSNQANNGPRARIATPSSNWTSSTSVAGFWGSGYYAAPTAAVADAAEFEFKLDTAETREVFAWWTAASDRSTSTPFVIWNASGTRLATVNQDQTKNGGRWVSLGRFAFTAGWNKVAVSRWTTPGDVVIADAIRID